MWLEPIVAPHAAAIQAIPATVATAARSTTFASTAELATLKVPFAFVRQVGLTYLQINVTFDRNIKSNKSVCLSFALALLATLKMPFAFVRQVGLPDYH